MDRKRTYAFEPKTVGRIMVEMRAAAVDALWAKSGSRMGVGQEAVTGKLKAAQQAIDDATRPLWPPTMVADDTDQGLCLRVMEGRHRLAAMRDAGWDVVPVAMPMPTYCILYDAGFEMTEITRATR